MHKNVNYTKKHKMQSKGHDSETESSCNCTLNHDLKLIPIKLHEVFSFGAHKKWGKMENNQMGITCKLNMMRQSFLQATHRLNRIHIPIYPKQLPSYGVYKNKDTQIKWPEL